MSKGTPNLPIQTAYFSFLGSINEEAASKICASFNHAMNNGAQEIHLAMSSRGGDVNSGVYLHNYLRSLPVQVRIHALADVQSVAVLVFAAGTVRTCSASTTFLIHPTTYGPVTHAMPATVLRERLDSILTMETHINRLLSERTSLSNETLQSRLFGDVAISADDALSTGIVHHISELNLPAGQEVFQI